jgi:Uma2 family endonuclease
MSTVTPLVRLTPEDVERASERDGKLYELIDGELREKKVGFEALFVAGQIIARLNVHFYPHEGAAATEVMIYCFNGRSHGRKPDVVYVRLSRLPNNEIPEGDIFVPPDLVVEVLSPGNSGSEVDEKLDEYLGAGIPLVWIVNPDRKSIRVFRQDGTTRSYHAGDVIENEPALPGFRLVVGEVFPADPSQVIPHRPKE